MFYEVLCTNLKIFLSFAFIIIKTLINLFLLNLIVVSIAVLIKSKHNFWLPTTLFWYLSLNSTFFISSIKILISFSNRMIWVPVLTLRFSVWFIVVCAGEYVSKQYAKIYVFLTRLLSLFIMMILFSIYWLWFYPWHGSRNKMKKYLLCDKLFDVLNDKIQQHYEIYHGVDKKNYFYKNLFLRSQRRKKFSPTNYSRCDYFFVSQKDKKIHNFPRHHQ